MDLDFDLEPPERRIWSWLSQADPEPFSFESFDVTGIVHDCITPWKLSSVVCSNVGNKVTRHLSIKDGGLRKYLEYNSSDHSIARSDSENSFCSYKLYCHAERKSIIQYIVDRKLFALVKGNSIWKQMEEERICARTWQSMKAQFQKYILQHLEDFQLNESDRNSLVKCMQPCPTRKFPRLLSPGQQGWRKNCRFYTYQEDIKILCFILERNRYEFTSGNVVWKKLESKKIVPGRSWHSLKSRYKKFLSKYVLRFAPTNKQAKRLTRKKFDILQKKGILQDFLLDILLNTSKECIPNFSVNKLNSLGVNCVFSIPSPSTSSVSEKEDIEQRTINISQQLSEKLNLIKMFSENTPKKCKKTNLLSSNFSYITDNFNVKNASHSLLDRSNDVIRNDSVSSEKFDLSAGVQHGLKISVPMQKHTDLNSERTTEQCPEMRVEKSTNTSPIEIDSSQNTQLTQETQIDEMCSDACCISKILYDEELSQNADHLTRKNFRRKIDRLSSLPVTANELSREFTDCSKYAVEILEKTCIFSDVSSCKHVFKDSLLHKERNEKHLQINKRLFVGRSEIAKENVHLPKFYVNYQHTQSNSGATAGDNVNVSIDAHCDALDVGKKSNELDKIAYEDSRNAIDISYFNDKYDVNSSSWKNMLENKKIETNDKIGIKNCSLIEDSEHIQDQSNCDLLEHSKTLKLACSMESEKSDEEMEPLLRISSNGSGKSSEYESDAERKFILRISSDDSGNTNEYESESDEERKFILRISSVDSDCEN